MDSFELSSDNYNPAGLRGRGAGTLRTPVVAAPDDLFLEDIDESRTPADDDIPASKQAAEAASTTEAPARKRSRTRQSRTGERTDASAATRNQPSASAAAEALQSEEPGAARIMADHISRGVSQLPRVKDFFADGRFRIFLGVIFMLFSAYLLLASISYISNINADQSVLLNSTNAAIRANASQVSNSTGWFGAAASHFLVYRWLGIGSFILIFYIFALGLTLVGLTRFKLWALTFKSLLLSITVSFIAGLTTFWTESPMFWGGEHGHYMNAVLIDNASLWSSVAVAVALITAQILIFIDILTRICSTLGNGIGNIRSNMARRHDEAVEAVHRTEMRQQAEREAEMKRAAKAAAEAAVESTATEELPDESFDTVLDSDISAINAASATSVDIAATNSTIPASTSPFAPKGPSSVITLTDVDETPAKETETADTMLPAPQPRRAGLDELFAPVKADSPDRIMESMADSTDSATESDMDTSGTNVSVPASTAEAGTSVSNFISLDATDEAPTISLDSEHDTETETDTAVPLQIETASPVVKAEIDDVKSNAVTGNAYDPTADLSHYKMPAIDLLFEIDDNGAHVDEIEQEENKQRIINILRAYDVEISSIRATIGPTITLYEIKPAPGVRISKIRHLGDDVALNLAAMGIRIIAPIPGRGTIGMEVPNKEPRVVSIRSILSSKAYIESKAQLPIALGTTISNEVYVADLCKMPHLLVAGATGMGKSVGLNTIIASLLYRKHPSELKFVLIDPKRVEFSPYRVIENHYLAKLPENDKAIVTEGEEVVPTLNSLCQEMEDRYELLSKAGMRGIKEYNEKFTSRQLNPEKGHRFLPYIVVIIDEFADLILTIGKDVETPISRIAAKARAIGIHMILATQRPSVNVITGVIKANFPGRIAFRVTQRNDSQTILDRPGAEQLIGRGDMIISRDGIMSRVQCAFIDTPEVEAICHHIASQQGYPSAYELPEVRMPGDGSGAATGTLTDRDPLFVDAGREVISTGTGSTSLIQRKFKIGYPRAGKIMDQLEMAGVVGPTQGGKPRAVLMDSYSFERYLEA